MYWQGIATGWEKQKGPPFGGPFGAVTPDQAGSTTTRRRGSSPSDRVVTPS